MSIICDGIYFLVGRVHRQEEEEVLMSSSQFSASMIVTFSLSLFLFMIALGQNWEVSFGPLNILESFFPCFLLIYLYCGKILADIQCLRRFLWSAYCDSWRTMIRMLGTDRSVSVVSHHRLPSTRPAGVLGYEYQSRSLMWDRWYFSWPCG